MSLPPHRMRGAECAVQVVHARAHCVRPSPSSLVSAGPNRSIPLHCTFSVACVWIARIAFAFFSQVFYLAACLLSVSVTCVDTSFSSTLFWMTSQSVPRPANCCCYLRLAEKDRWLCASFFIKGLNSGAAKMPAIYVASIFFSRSLAQIFARSIMPSNVIGTRLIFSPTDN